MKRFRDNGASYFAFPEKLFVSPTKNLAEQGVREWVLGRQFSYFAQSLGGLSTLEIFCSILGTL
jgi:hypothetical protein